MSANVAPQKNGPWFAVTMGLLGLIVGYGVGTGGLGSINMPGAPAQVIPGPSADAPAPSAAAAEAPKLSGDEWSLGSEDAPLTIVEWTDFQCPFCARHFTQTFGQIKKNYIDTGKVRYVMKNFPLSFHPNAQKAAEAAECAGAQGDEKYWGMHDALFVNQGEWSSSGDAGTLFSKYARELSLDMGTFESCLTSGATAEKVQKDMAEGSAHGIDGTPGFWVLSDGDDQQVSGAQPYEKFAALFDAMVK